ncbi:MAG: YhdP family protein [Porticoccaceae bacterium]
MKRFAGHVFRSLWLLTALLVIVYAIVVITAREMLPVINSYQAQINDYLSEKTGLAVNIHRLNGLWQGLTPRVELENVVIAGANGSDEAITLDRVVAELRVGKTLINLSPVWRSLTAGKIRLNLVEDNQGRWSIAGHPLASEQGSDLDYLYRMFFYSRLLKIDVVEIDARFFSGATAKIVARDIQVENNEDFHRTTARIATDENTGDMATLIFEGRGDPLDDRDFAANGYLSLNHLNVDGSLGIIARALLPQQAEELGRVDMDLDLKLWFSWDGSEPVKAWGTVDASEIPLEWLGDLAPLEALSGEITGSFKPGEHWSIGLQNLAARWGDAAVTNVSIQLRQGVGQRWGELSLATTAVDLAFLNQLALKTELLNQPGAEALAALNPRGNLRNLFIDANFSGDQPEFSLRGNLENIAVDSWRGAPAARGINGYVQAGLYEGFVVLDSPEGFAMHYHQAFDDFMTYGSTKGRVDWQWLPDQHRVRVTSTPITIIGEEGHAKAFLHLDLPTRKGGNPEMYLMVGLRNSDSRYVDKFLPKVLNPNLLSWLDDALGAANIEEAGFIWRGSLLKRNNDGRSIQVFATVKNGELAYQNGWPALENVSGQLVVDNRHMDAWVGQGRVHGANVKAAAVSLRQQGGEPVLRVAAAIDASVDSALGFLGATPLAEKMAAVTTLETSGNSHIELDLRIPLTAERRGEDYRVSAILDNASLKIPATKMVISEIQGRLNYSTAKGLYGKGLRGRFLGGAINADLNSAADTANIAVVANPDFGNLNEYLGIFAGRLSGQPEVTGRLRIPLQRSNKNLQLDLDSTLKTVAIDLPQPFKKEAEDELPLRATLLFNAESLEISGATGDKAGLALAFEDGQFDRGQLQLLSSQARLPQAPGLLISGNLETLDWKDWQPLLTADGRSGHDGGTSLTADTEATINQLRPQLDLQLGSFVFSDFDLGNTHLSGAVGDKGNWHFAIEAAQLAGTIRLPEQEKGVVALELDYLKLPERKNAQDAEGGDGDTESQRLANLDPRNIPAIDFAVTNLYIGDENFGSLAFRAQKIANGILIGDLEGGVRGIEIKAQPGVDESAETPAEMRWTIENGVHRTFFSGTLATGNIEEALKRWHIPAPLTSKSANFFAELGWQGQPWEISLLALDGYLGIEVIDGQFYKATGAATNTFFKLVSLVNFDTWLRRLRFDFSDLFSGGVSFDKIQGGLLFRQGMVDFDDPIVASMPSGKIRLLGSADLVYEQLDARLVATMPVGTNLPWVAGLLGGLPAVVGVYLTSKIFEKQVDQLSSISYNIKGSLDEPDIEVDRIFTDPTKTAVEKKTDD